MMLKRLATLGCAAILAVALSPVWSSAISVPGTSNPWLAGMPNGTISSFGDSAPGQSPVLATGLNLGLGGSLNFSVTGSVSNGPCCALLGPDGGSLESHLGGAENGIADVTAPLNALLGVFLDNTQPDSSGAPTSLDFTGGTSFPSLAPSLKQVFFIGDGLTGTGSGSVQSFVIPTGATRLFLGTMDGFEWNNNFGSFEVTTNQVPEPNSLLLIFASFMVMRIRKIFFR